MTEPLDINVKQSLEDTNRKLANKQARERKERSQELKVRAKQDERSVSKEIREYNRETERQAKQPNTRPLSPEQAVKKELQEMTEGLVAELDKPWAKLNEDLLSFDPNFRALAEYYDLKTEDYKSYAKKLETIFDWGKTKTKGNDVYDVLTAIQKQERVLGTHPFEFKLNTLYHWVVLSNYNQIRSK